jgi:hypothetical protein
MVDKRFIESGWGPGFRRLLTDARGRGPAFAASVVIIAGQAWVAHSLKLRPVWLFPAAAAVLLVTSVLLDVAPGSRADRFARFTSVALVGVLVIANIAGLAYLVHGVFAGSGLSPLNLLLTGVALWIVNVFVFAIVYWELDGGGPLARPGTPIVRRDLRFPQQENGELPAGVVWEPGFGDYLFVALTCATAFSPTDAMPYTGKAKLAMGVEAVMSMAIAALLVARAVNIAKG